MPDRPASIPTRPLGSTGIAVPVLGLGTVKLGRNTGVKYPQAFELPTDQQAIELLATARELGVTLLDTAPAYGAAEERLGALLARTDALGGRDAWTIATKAGEAFDPESGASRFDFSPAGITASVHQSLARLRTDRLDLVLLHSDGNDMDILRHSGALEALRRLKEEGRVRAIGISTKTPEGAMLAVELCDVVMLTINPGYAGDEPAAAEAARRGVGVLVKKALLSGHVGSTGAGATPADCLRYALGVAGVSVAIIGTINPDHLRANVAAAIAASA